MVALENGIIAPLQERSSMTTWSSLCTAQHRVPPGMRSSLSWWGLVLLAMVCLWPSETLAQSASIGGVIRDPQGQVVSGASVELVEQKTGLSWATQSNGEGLYVFAAVKPSTYRLGAEAKGFARTTQKDIELHVDERATVDLALTLANQSETVEVQGRPMLGTTDGSVGTVLNETLLSSIPVRGRSFSSAVALAPGVMRSYTMGSSDSGSEFAVNGQRDTSNGLFVDGVSALSEISPSGIGSGVGHRFAANQTSTVNGGVSLEAVQEIRVQTSTFAAEFGRTPGAQISLVTRSGSNRFTGSAFEQFRNESLMANDWFANSQGVPKADSEEHQFGAALGGPLVRQRLFFFGSYEGLRLRRPQFQNVTVPSLEARQLPSAIRDVLNLYPAPTGPSRPGLVAAHGAYYSRRYWSDTWGGRLDGSIRPGLQIFGRFSQSPSASASSSVVVSSTRLEKKARSLTGGMTAMLGNRMLLDLRGSYGRATTGSGFEFSELRALFPTLPEGGRIEFDISSMPILRDGLQLPTLLRQGNVVASLSYLAGTHQFKAGVDYRRLASALQGAYSLTARLQNLEQAIQSNVATLVTASRTFPIHATFQNLSFYAQDTWRARQRLSLTYGLRWDINPSPTFGAGEGPLRATTVNPISSLRLLTTPNQTLWDTNYGNVFPRLGASYALDSSGRTVLSGGIGLFGDLEGAAVGDFQVSARHQSQRVPLPLSAQDVVDVPRPMLEPPLTIFSSIPDPNLETPRTLQMNVALQRMLGARQTVSATYVASRGDHLLQSRYYREGATPDFATDFFAVTATGRARYNALQLQYQGRPMGNLSVLGSYTLGSSRDTTSSIAAVDAEEGLATASNDIRHLGTLSVNWLLPGVRNRLIGRLVNDWSVDIVGNMRSGYPVTVYAQAVYLPGQEYVQARGSLVPGQTAVLDDPSAPAGRRLNPEAFTSPPLGQQGTTRRNQFRWVPSAQMDFALQRRFSLTEGASLRFRLDVFNAFNTPVFSQPQPVLGNSFFGRTFSMQASGIGALYQPGGPRSATVSLRLQF